MMRTLWAMGIAALLVLPPGIAITADTKADFPKGQITYVLGFAPGGKTDIQARAIMPYVEKYLGVPITIQNSPGAGGRIGLTKLFKAKPDGYTIGLLPVPAAILGEHLADTSYKTQELTPIFACFVTPQVLLVAADTFKDLDELIKAGKARSLTHATPGHGTSSHLAGIVTASGLGIREVRQVHYESSGPSLAALAGKHVDFSVTNTTSAVPLVQSGMLKPLLLIAEERDPAFPQVPTPKELGYKITAIHAIDGFGGPPNLPPDKLKILEEAFAKASADPEFLNWAKKAKVNVAPMDHERFRLAVAETAREVDKYKDFLVEKQ